jgi:hypothetical protein
MTDVLNAIANRRYRRTARTGIEHVPGREQPYTIYWKGEVIGFSATEKDAELRLAAKR